VLPVFNEHVIIKSIFNGWTVAQVASVVKFHGLPENMSTGVPVHLHMQDRDVILYEIMSWDN
jgi:hypothetical protein